ncbi:MAG TPA: type II toxin-antitoxin system VapC family toxin, partial [Acidimicrobiales bacterium]|nr:type II toxin-antitoxin system VapC family toxin [Acidimicrobiales bacterium]
LDASVLANALADDGEDGRRAREELLTQEQLAAPDLIDVETVSVLRKRWLEGTVSDSRFETALDDLETLELDRYPTLQLMRRAFELRANVTPYDAAYVALAEAMDCELLTADERLARSPGPRCRFRVLA